MAYFPTKVLDNQIKALATVSTASGSVATFTTDMTENLVEVECEIVYQQASGTPSPSNPLPITTFSEMNVMTTSKNLYDISQQTQTSINTFLTVKVKPNTDYVFSVNIQQTGLYAQCWNGSNWADISKIYNNSVLSFNSGIYEEIRLRTYREGSQTNPTQCQLEYGTTATTYEPFGNTYNIPFGQTVAKGTLNVGTGVLEITHKTITLDGTQAVGTRNWRPQANSVGWLYSSVLTDAKKPAISSLPDAKSDKLQTVSYNSIFANDIDSFAILDSGAFYTLAVRVRDTSLTTDTAINAWLAQNPITIMYEVDTPQEIQLDSITIQALLNENNIWCDTGDTSVKFILSVGEYVNQNV